METLNKATSMIKNDWFCYASSNDVALPGKLKKEIEMCKKNNKFVCYSDYNVTDINLKTMKKHKFPSFNYNLLLKGNLSSGHSHPLVPFLFSFTSPLKFILYRVK